MLVNRQLASFSIDLPISARSLLNSTQRLEASLRRAWMFAAVVEDVEVFPDGALVAVDLEALPDAARFHENEEAGFLE